MYGTLSECSITCIASKLMANKRTVIDGTGGKPSLKDILKNLGPIKDMSDEEYRIFLRSQNYNEETGIKKGGKSSGGHAPGPSSLGMSIDEAVKERRKKIIAGNKQSKEMEEFLKDNDTINFPDKPTNKKNPVKKKVVKKANGGMATKWESKWR